MPFGYLSFFNRIGTAKRDTIRSILGLPGLRDRDLVTIGLTNIFPVLRLGHFLIKFISPPGLNVTSMPLLIGEIKGGPIIVEGKEMFYNVGLTDIASNIESGDIHIIDTNTRLSIGRNRVIRTLENICFDGKCGLHLCDMPMKTGDGNRWYVQAQYLIYKKGMKDYDWTVYASTTDLYGTKKYKDRKNKLLNKIIGSRVKITDKSIFKDLKFKNKTGEVVCTIPDISVIASSKKLLKALVINFGEDVGGHSVDGRYKKGSCLVVPPGKVRIEGG